MQKVSGLLTLLMLLSSTALPESLLSIRKPEIWQCATNRGVVVVEALLNWIEGDVVGALIVDNAFYPANVSWTPNNRAWAVQRGGEYRLLIAEDVARDEDGYHSSTAYEGRFESADSSATEVICSDISGPSVRTLGRSL